MPIPQYTGAFTKKELTHLLRRTMFGAKKDDITYFADQSLISVVNELLNPTSTTVGVPLKDYVETNAITPDSTVLSGETWVNNINNDGTIQSRRNSSYKKWYTGLLINQDRSIQEKLTLFWINHFGTEMDTFGNANFAYKQNVQLRNFALGNFKQMVKYMTTDLAMLRYLNGYLNRVQAPDENYARELQELFTVGKALGVNGYTESDVQEAAKVLTGWRIDYNTYTYYFQTNWHNTANKTFSAFYNNTVITGSTGTTAGETELDSLLNMIFLQEEVAKHIVRKIYRWFVYYKITPEIETNIIVPLAETFRNANYEIKPVLRELFISQHFFDIAISQGAIIKSPVDFYIGGIREWNVQFPDAVTAWSTNYKFWNYIHSYLISSTQNLHDPNSVAGYPAYYQEPQFHEMWINATTYPLRKKFTDLMVNSGYSQDSIRIKYDVLAFTTTLTNPSNPNELVTEVVDLFLGITISEVSKQQLKTQYLLSGQTTDDYWTTAWVNYANNPTNTSFRNIVETRLKSFYIFILSVEEYQLS